MPIRVHSKREASQATVSAGSLPFGLPPVPAGTPQKPAGVSLCMIVKNEERFLEQCLRSVAGAVDEICIVDTGSTDRTVEIAKTFGARVLERAWRNDFAWARNEAIGMASKRWILMLDADEELTPQSTPALRKLANALAGTVGVWLRVLNKSDDYGGTGAMSHALVRIFPNDERIRFRGLIHEYITLDGSTNGLPAVTAPIEIVHHGYLKEVVHSRNKGQRNLEIVEAAVAADPDDAFTWFNLGSTAFMLQDFARARDALEKMREINGDAPRGFITNGHAVLAEIYCDKFDDPVKGEEVSRAGLTFSPHYANGHFQLGKALVAQGRFDEGRAAFEEAIADGAYNHLQFVVDDQVSIWKAHSEIGSSYVAQGDEANAIAWFRKGLANAPTVQPLRLNLARALERNGDIEEARAYYRGVYEDFADGPSIVDYVNFLLRRGEAEAALAVVDASHANVDDAIALPVFSAAAHVAIKLGRPADEIRYLELAAERLPGSAEILNWLEARYAEQGNDAAIAALEAREAKTEPTSSADYLRRSYKANVAHDFERGLALSLAGLALAPDDEHMHYNAAVAAGALGHLSDALEHLAFVKNQQAAVYIPAQLMKANVYRRLDRGDEALGALEAVLALEGGNLDALKARAEIYESRGNVAAAEGSYRLMMDVDRKAGAVEFAAFLLRNKRFDEAARVADAGLSA